nr:DUF222 domain-containing protein [Mycobacterium uberis]
MYLIPRFGESSGDPKFVIRNGLPVIVIVSTTLQELTSGAGRAVTSGGTPVPIRDLIRIASYAYHYLAAFQAAQCTSADLAESHHLANGPVCEGSRLYTSPAVTHLAIGPKCTT